MAEADNSVSVRGRHTLKKRHNAFEQRGKSGVNPQADGACMIDEQCKAMHLVQAETAGFTHCGVEMNLMLMSS